MRSGKTTPLRRPSCEPARGTPAHTAPTPTTPRPFEDVDAIPMWAFYKTHRDQLIADVRLHREHILAAIRGGVTVEDAFRPYMKDAGASSRPEWPSSPAAGHPPGGASGSRKRQARASAPTPPAPPPARKSTMLRAGRPPR